MCVFVWSDSRDPIFSESSTSRSRENPLKIEWDLTNGPRSVSCDRAIRYSGLGFLSVGPVEDFLEKRNMSQEWFTFLKQEMFVRMETQKSLVERIWLVNLPAKIIINKKLNPKFMAGQPTPPKRTPLRKQRLIAGVINGNQWLINRE